MQILTFQSSVVALNIHLEMELCMKGTMRHLVLLHTMLKIHKDGPLVMLDYLLGATILNTKVSCLISSPELWTQSSFKQHGSLLHH